MGSAWRRAARRAADRGRDRRPLTGHRRRNGSCAHTDRRPDRVIRAAIRTGAGLARSQLGVAVGLVADGSEAASAQHALAHDRNSPSGAWSVLRCNEAISLTIPDAIGQTTSLPPSRVAGVWPQRPPPMPRWDAT